MLLLCGGSGGGSAGSCVSALVIFIFNSIYCATVLQSHNKQHTTNKKIKKNKNVN